MAAEAFKVGQRVRIAKGVSFWGMTPELVELARLPIGRVAVPRGCLDLTGTCIRFAGGGVADVVDVDGDIVTVKMPDGTRCSIADLFIEPVAPKADSPKYATSPPKWSKWSKGPLPDDLPMGGECEPATIPAPLKPGDVVRLASGGPAMTLHGTEGDLAYVVWWEEGKVRWEDVPLSALVRCEPVPK